ncbi:hypothetical protein TKK_0012982 [Trichogramma kaykai]
MPNVVCSYENCNNSNTRNSELTFHRFLKDNDQRQKWFVRSGNGDFINLSDKTIANKRICSQHFLPNFFLAKGLQYGALPFDIEVDFENDRDDRSLKINPLVLQEESSMPH